MGANVTIGKLDHGAYKETVRAVRARRDDTVAMEVLNVYDGLTDQTISGFGGAITDAVCVTLERLPEAVQEELLQLYFGAEGIGYNTLRVTLDSCDFAARMYAAADDWKKGDPGNRFAFTEDEVRMNRYLHRIYEIAGKPLPILLCPWSPLAVMKDNQSRIGGHLLKDRYEDWADYVCRYIEELQKEGFLITAVTAQNEPDAWQIWDSCVFGAEEEAEYIAQALAPALKEHGLSDIGIWLWDHNKERMLDRVEVAYESPAWLSVKGIAFHWYTGDHFDAVRLAHRLYPEVRLVFSEGCVEYSRFGGGSGLEYAQHYAHDMIGNLRGGMDTFYDWNIVLDEEGGPNHVGNFCDAPILCDTKAGTYERHLSFEYIAAITRAVKPGAIRLETTVYTDDIENAAFRNPDGEVAVVMLNRTKHGRRVDLRVLGKAYHVQLPKESISVLRVK